MDYFSCISADGSLRTPLVDLRSPTEFAQGAMPAAINIPLFSDEERALIGTTYKQQGAREATQLGLECLAGRMNQFLDVLLEAATPEKRLILHCWRGGMRSHSVAMLLRAVGVDVTVLVGGYKAFRRQVLDLINALSRHHLIVIDGRTGSGKTDLLRELMSLGKPCIDLEGLAAHRGSAFGDLQISKPQPSQQNFENNLALQYWRIRNSPIIAVEAEQNIGTILMPHNLREHLYAEKILLVDRDHDDRVRRLVAVYAPNWKPEDSALFLSKLALLKSRVSNPAYDQMVKAIHENQLAVAASLLLEHRYDKAYDKSLERRRTQIIAQFNLSHEYEKARTWLIDYLP